jgi:hypothetical protein
VVDDVREEVFIVPVKDVSGGVNNFLFEGDIGDNQSVAQKNMNISKPGLRRKRDGYTSFADDTGDADKMRLFNFNPDAIAERLIAYAADQLYEWTGTGNWVSIGTALATDSKMDAFQADNEIYFLIDATNVQSWDGTTLTDEADTNTDPPQGSTGLFKFGRGFISGLTSNPNLVYYSNQSTGAGIGSGAWNRTAQNIEIKGIGSGDQIVKIVSFRQSDIIVFTQRSIWSINIADSTPSNWTVREVHSNIGCGARDSAVVAGNDIIFMDQNGKFRSLVRTVEDLNQGIDPIPTSQAIDGHIDTFSGTNLSNASAIAFDRFYFVAVTLSASENDAVFVYDTVIESWTGPWTAWNATNFAVSTTEGGKESLYFGNSGSTSEGFKYAIGTFTDDGAAIEYQETSKKYDLGNNRLDKLWQSIEIIAESTGNSDIDVECQIDDDGFISVGTMNLTGGGPTLPVDFPFTLGTTGFLKKIFNIDALLGAGRYIQFRLTHDDSGEECRIISVQFAGYVENINYGGPAA